VIPTQSAALQESALSAKDPLNAVRDRIRNAKSRRFRKLDLSGQNLYELPSEIGQLQSLERLDISNNQLTELPDELWGLTRLKHLNLAENRLSHVPIEIERLQNLGGLDLSGNLLTSLPGEIRQLTTLKHLFVNRNQLETLPSDIGRLRGLNTLFLTNNRLTTLPPEIGRLARLRTLIVSNNLLEELPSEISKLAQLQRLDVSNNRLQSLDPEIGQLKIATLSLHHNRLLTLPGAIGDLSALTSLDLSHNELLELPPTIAKLGTLETLDLRGNLFVTLPAEIGRLTTLTSLDLSDNELIVLPPEMGELPEEIFLKLQDNPLDEPLPELARRGTRELFAYLRSLLEGADPQYEAKVLLVGEGNVGKTSLVDALQDRPFVENRPTTHGIQIEVLDFPHPDLDERLQLNTWDFGGQEVYRITHQFFFSRRALYIVVWRPREGQQENAIEGWLRQIRLRVGKNARVLIVATHCDERNPELDFPTLKREFGDLLVGHYKVDNFSGTGIDDLRNVIAAQAAKLPQMGELVPSRWLLASEDILKRREPQIAHTEFAAACGSHGLDGEATATLANLLHDLGHIIYYAGDEGLRDIVVLQPEWLTKAIGYVLEDTPTREAGGVLYHSRLKEIWQGREDGERYPAEYHPYFLRLMEKFDVSYRLPEEEQASLVGQLVPYERPELPWDRTEYTPDNRSLSLVCNMAEPVLGLLAWLTVRNHRFSTDRHWRRGVFLEHSEYVSTALFELLDDRRLALKVLAPSPDYFFSILRDSLEDLIKRRWPGLSYVHLIPCPTPFEEETLCTGQFPLRTLLKYREQNRPEITCQECIKDHDVSRLLTGFESPSVPLRPTLEIVRAQLDEVVESIHRAESIAATTANEVRTVLKVLSAEVTDCPRFFTLAAMTTTGWSRAAFWKYHYKLTLWCEDPGRWHPLPEATYELTPPKEWLRTIGPYANLVTRTLRLVVPIAGAAAGVVWSEKELEGTKQEIDLMQTLVQSLPTVTDDDIAISVGAQLTAAQGAGLRALRNLLFEKDPSRRFGGLRRVQDPSGDFIWICPQHYPEYDPGLPELPE
jgi:internalin A